jgi:glycosyltransferase involved in cell wall biosynthesis
VAFVEQVSIRFADLAITCTEQMREAFVARGASPDKVKVVLNASDEAVFDRTRHLPSTRDPERLVLICHGSVESIYGLDTAIRAVALLRSELPNLTLQIYGEGSVLEELRDLVAELGVGEAVWFSGKFVPIDELLDAISAADAGVVAMRRDAFRDLAHCNKMYDYIAMGRPVICSRTRSVEAYFDADCFQFFTAGDEQDLARAIRQLYEDPELGERLVHRAEEVNEPHRWEHQRLFYQATVTELLQA